MAKKEAKKNWENSEYTELVRMNKIDKEYLREQKGEFKSMAGFLHFIIQLYKADKLK